MKISTKLLGAICVMLLLVFFENLLHQRDVARLEKNMADFKAIILPASAIFHVLNQDVARFPRMLNRSVGRAPNYRATQSHLKQAREFVDQGLILDPQTHAEWQTISQDLNVILQSWAEFEDLWPIYRELNARAPDQARELQSETMEPLLLNTLGPAIVEFDQQMFHQLENEIERIGEGVQSNHEMRSLVTGLLCVFALVVALSVFRTVIAPLNALTASARAITAGNRALRVTHPRQDELGVLAKAFNGMLDQEQNTTGEFENLNSRLDFLLSASPAIIFSTPPEPGGAPSFISKNQETILGYTAEEFLSPTGSWSSRIHPEDLEQALAESQEVLAHGHYRHDYRFQHKNGEWLWLRSERHLVKRPDGTPAEIIGCVTDITAEKTALDQQETYRKRLDLALNATALCTWDNEIAQGRLTLDSRWSTMRGGAPVETVTTARTELSLVHPDDRALSLNATRRIQDRECNSYELEHRVRTVKGDWRWILTNGRVVERNDQGAPTRVIGINTDVTVRKEAELELQKSRTQFELALHSAGLGAWHWEISSDRLTLDPQTHELHQLDPATFTGEPEAFLQSVHPDDRGLIRDAWERSLHQDERFEVEYRVFQEEGAIRHIHNRGKLVRDAAGKPLRLDAVARDTTTAKQAEALLRADAARSAQLFLTAPAATSLSDLATGEFIEVNDRFVELIDRPRDTLIGRVSTEIGLWQDPSDRIKLEETMRREGRVTYAEISFKKRDGSSLVAGTSVSLVDLGGRRCALTCLVDLAPLHAANAALRQHENLISSISSNLAGTCIYRIVRHPDGSSTCPYISANSAEILGVTPAEFQASPQSIFPLINEADFSDFEQALKEARHSKKSTSVTIRLTHRNGRQLWIQLRSQFVETLPDGSQVRNGIAVDMTAHNQVQAELTTVRERLELALHASNTCTWHFDLPGDELILDPGWNAMRGYPALQTAGTSRLLMSAVYREDRSVVAAALRHVIYSPVDDYRIEHRVTTATNNWIWIRSQGRVTERDNNGKAIRMVGTNTDITDRKIAQDKAKQQAAFITSLHETTLDLLDRRDIADILHTLTKRTATQLDAPFIELLLKEGPELIVHSCHGDLTTQVGQKLSRDQAPLSWQVLESGQTTVLSDYRNWPHAPNAYDDIQTRATMVLPLIRGNQTLGLISMARDVSNRPFTEDDIHRGEMIARITMLVLHNATLREEAIKEAEQRTAALRQTEDLFHSVFDASPIPITLSSLPEDRLIEVNTAFLANFGVAREDVIGRSAEELNIWDQPSLRQEFLRRIIRDGSCRDFEVVTHTKSGTECIMLCTGTLLTIAGQKRMITCAVAITDLRRAETEKNRLHERVFQNQKYEALGTLAGGVAHDFNNILTGIINYTTLAQVECPDDLPHLHDYLTPVLEGSNRAKELVRQILLFSRSEVTEYTPLLCQDVITEALSLLRSTIPATVEIRPELDADSPTVMANATQLHQIITNLGINASHALSKQGGLITIQLNPHDVDESLVAELPELTPGPYVLLRVIDNGSGMEQAIMDRIFEPFFTTKQVGEGTGLGLSVIRSVIQDHSGAIRVSSEVGQGSTFEVYLPVHRTEPAVVIDALNLPLPSGENRHILLVDDEKSVAESLELMLVPMGYRVSAASNPHQALEYFHAAPDDFDILLTDYQMPGMTGLDLAAQIHVLRPDLPVYMTTGYADGMSREEMMNLGITDLLNKPFEITELATMLAQDRKT